MSLAERIAQELLLPILYVRHLGASASHHYKTYRIPKQRGGFRTIHHPSRELKSVQRWVLSRQLGAVPVHPAAKAYQTGLSIADNARPHAPHRFLLRMDLEEFFSSITETDIRQHVARNESHYEMIHTEEDLTLFVNILTRDGVVTIGAPTSPTLSNVLCFELDTELTRFAEERAITYTRYADDLFFSCDEPRTLSEIESVAAELVEECKCPANLRINAGKTYHASKKGRRVVTGLTLTCDGEVSVGRQMKRRIRTLVFTYDELSVDVRRTLAGLLAYVRSIEPDFINRLVLKYGSERVRTAMHPPSQNQL